MVAASALAEADSLPSVFYSPNHKYSAEIIAPDTYKIGNDSVLVVRSGKNAVVRAAANGYITEVYWSSDQNYVAINNRNAESGDYLWVISLHRGRVVRKPFDHVLKYVDGGSKYPEYKKFEFHKGWIFATGWDKRGELGVREDVLYRNIDDYIAIDYVYSVKDGRLRLVSWDLSKRRRWK